MPTARALPIWLIRQYVSPQVASRVGAFGALRLSEVWEAGLRRRLDTQKLDLKAEGAGC